MNTNNTNEKTLLFKEEVFQIVGAAMEVLNEVGHGFHEKPYENALVIEFGLRNIPFKQQPNFNILYKGHGIGLFVPDLIAFEKIVVDADEARCRSEIVPVARDALAAARGGASALQCE